MCFGSNGDYNYTENKTITLPISYKTSYNIIGVGIRIASISAQHFSCTLSSFTTTSSTRTTATGGFLTIGI